MPNVILTNEKGEDLGLVDSAKAHAGKGLPHLAISAFLFTEDEEHILLSKRAQQKRFGGLVANACCTHPRKGESKVKTGERRLKEELGITCPNLKVVGTFMYHKKDPKREESEYEHDTVLKGTVEKNIEIDANPEEIEMWFWEPVKYVIQDLKDRPDRYAPWFEQALKIALKKHANQ